MENKIMVSIPEEVIAAVSEKLIEITTSLHPYLIALSPEERQTMPKMSDKTLPFVEKTMAYTQSAPQFAPPYMDVEGLLTDMKVHSQLMPLYREVRQLIDGLDDGALGNDGLRHNPHNRHTATRSRRHGVVQEVFEGEGNGRSIMLLDKNSVVHKVLGACPSVADGGDNRVHPLNPVFKLPFSVRLEGGHRERAGIEYARLAGGISLLQEPLGHVQYEGRRTLVVAEQADFLTGKVC